MLWNCQIITIQSWECSKRFTIIHHAIFHLPYVNIFVFVECYVHPAKWLKHTNITDVTGFQTFNFSTVQSLTQIVNFLLAFLLMWERMILYLLWSSLPFLAPAEFQTTGLLTTLIILLYLLIFCFSQLLEINFLFIKPISVTIMLSGIQFMNDILNQPNEKCSN